MATLEAKASHVRAGVLDIYRSLMNEAVAAAIRLMQGAGRTDWSIRSIDDISLQLRRRVLAEIYDAAIADSRIRTMGGDLLPARLRRMRDLDLASLKPPPTRSESGAPLDE